MPKKGLGGKYVGKKKRKRKRKKSKKF